MTRQGLILLRWRFSLLFIFGVQSKRGRLSRGEFRKLEAVLFQSIIDLFSLEKGFQYLLFGCSFISLEARITEEMKRRVVLVCLQHVFLLTSGQKMSTGRARELSEKSREISFWTQTAQQKSWRRCPRILLLVFFSNLQRFPQIIFFFSNVAPVCLCVFAVQCLWCTQRETQFPKSSPFPATRRRGCLWFPSASFTFPLLHVPRVYFNISFLGLDQLFVVSLSMTLISHPHDCSFSFSSRTTTKTHQQQCDCMCRLFMSLWSLSFVIRSLAFFFLVSWGLESSLAWLDQLLAVNDYDYDEVVVFVVHNSRDIERQNFLPNTMYSALLSLFPYKWLELPFTLVMMIAAGIRECLHSW
jgi:hypothetical protein